MTAFLRLLPIALLFAASLAAQPVVSLVKVVPSHGSVLVRADITDGASQSQLQLLYGTTPSLGSATYNVAAANAVTARTLVESGLSPSTTYYFRIRVTAASGTTMSSCSPGSSGPGWTCDSGSGLAMFTTEALPAQHGEPASPVPVDTSMPAVNGQTFPVAADCSNLQPMLNACAAANPSLVHQVTIPAGAVCSGSYTLPLKTGPGTCIVRTAAPDSALPPEGTRISSDYTNAMPLILPPYRNIGATPTPLGAIQSAANTQGWRLVGLRFALPSIFTHRKIAISSISNAGVITTAQPHGLQFYQKVYITGVQGFNGRGPNGIWKIAATGLSTLTLFNTDYGALGTPNYTCASAPCHVPGTGVILQLGANAISEVSSSTPPVVTTTLEHGLFNEPWSSIVSASGNTITLAGGHFLNAHTLPLEISGSSVPVYNGRWKTNGTTGNTLTLVGGPAASCSADCGQVRIKRALHIKGVTGATAVNGNHIFTVVDDTHLQIDTAAGGQSYSGGGSLIFDPDFWFRILSLDSTSSRIVVDRCIITGATEAEWGQRVLYGIQLHSNDSGVVDSRVEGIQNGRTINPVTGLYEPQINDLNISTSVALEITAGRRKRFHNNYLNAVGITTFAQEWGPANTTNITEDVTFTKNVVYTSPVNMAGSSTSNGLYYPKRHLFEMKQGRRFKIDGNVFDGNWSDNTPCGPALALSVRSLYSSSRISDVQITNNTFRNTSSAIQISGTDSYSYATMDFLTQRIRIENNLMHDIDNRKWASVPSLTGGGICGYGVQVLWPIEDLAILHNTVFDMRGKQPQFFSYGYGRSEGVVVRNNLFSHNHDNGAGALTPATQLAGLTPSISGTIKQAWDQYFRSGSEFRDNVVIPGVKSTATQSNYDSTSTAQSYRTSDCVAYYAGFPGITCAGSGAAGETANQRIATTKFHDSVSRDLRLRSDSPMKAGLRVEGLDAGVDISALERAQGKVRNVRARATSNAAVVSYVAPDSAACFVDYGRELWPSSSRLSDGGGSITRSVSLTGLTPGKLYYYRVQCAADQPSGSFVTER